MELILQTGLEHQEIPVKAVADAFDNVHIGNPNQYYENPILDFSNKGAIMGNIQQVQKQTNLHLSLCKPAYPENDCLNLDIKMETGTGKTYVYTHLMYELHKRYGINKFVVAVPTLPIKAGAKQFMADDYVQRHFKDTRSYGTNIELCELKAMTIKKGKRFFPSVVRNFVEGSNQNKNKIFVLLVNMNLLTGAKLLSRDDYDFGVMGYYRPFDAIRATRPFVIIDEPHRFQRGQKAYQAITEELQPQCIIRLGATFPETTVGRGKNKVTNPDYLNLLYDLNACQAFNKNLIKGVAKEHFEPLSSSGEKVKITSIDGRSSVSIRHISSNAPTRSFRFAKGDSLSVISNELSGLTIDGIGSGFVMFSNGQEKRTGEEFTVDVFSRSYQEQMIRLALLRHFETERENFNRTNKIKTLTLFFIDNIESYRGGDDGSAWLKEMFERLLMERINEEVKLSSSKEYKAFLQASLDDISACHAGYFAQDNSDSDEAIAQEVDDILHNKKRLLSFTDANGNYNTRRFLFSKWTLKEGWDNPNIFTIVKLRSSGSDNSKIQEVGRGLRLPVDEFGNRLGNEEFMLNYIVDFTEADFANRLVAEINGSLPEVLPDRLTADEIERVAKMRETNSFALIMELGNKKYITDANYTLNKALLDDFYAEYPEFNMFGISGTKVIDKNKKASNSVKVRQARFDEIKELWMAINKKYVLFYQKDIDELIREELPLILSDGVFSYQTISSDRTVIRAVDLIMRTSEEAGVTYVIKGRKLPYSDFLKLANRATSISIKALHEALCKYAKKNELTPEHINETTLSNLIKKFNEWLSDKLQGRFRYQQTHYTPLSTGLTNMDGTMKKEVVQGSIGIHLENGNVSERYLYDAIAYDSPLEKKNIMETISQVIVFGKIPRKSIAIPTIAGSSYSPDFMYVVQKADGKKELNIIVETKDVENKTEIRGEEELKINSAKEFFKQLTLDGYDVKYRTQLNKKAMASIIEELMEES
ncbi:MAG: type III restriction-modification system endonuclease [Bacteroidales bacterium]|jgi:type III restriction enzyme